MPFIYKKNLKPGGGRVLEAFTLADSTAFTVGMAVNLASGVLAECSGDELCLGIIVSIHKADGTPVTDNGAGADYAGTYTTTTSNTIQATVDMSIDSIYSVVADGTIGTTNGSNLPGINIDAASGGLTLSETSAVAVATTATFFSYGEDTSFDAPANSLLVSIQESQYRI